MADRAEPDLVRGAGGVIWRHGDSGLEVLVVHRARYDDWSFPKGKALADEDDVACARREVAEETGLECELGPEVATSHYRDQHGRPKVVTFFAMTPASGSARAADETDGIAWIGLDRARQLLTWPGDRRVLDSFARAAPNGPGER